jgi:trehalose 6-phosphate phosphatase
MAQLLFDHLSDIESMLRPSRRVMLFLDFDGTLAPIVEIPEQAEMRPETRVLLERLSRNDLCSVVIVSGRALTDIRERVGLAELIYAGNHGLEISGGGLNFVEPEAVQRIKLLGELSRRLRERLRHIPGVVIENKVLTATIHFRRVQRGGRNEIQKAVYEEVAFSDRIFRVTQGLEVFEIRPRVDWNKGTAVRWIEGMKGGADTFALYIGDDMTDEDAFFALPEGITIRVGQVTGTAARYYLERQESVVRFLAWLVEAISSGILGNSDARAQVANIRRS